MRGWKPAVALLALLSALLLSSCTARPRVFLVTDQASARAVGGREELRSIVARAAGPSGLELRVLVGLDEVGVADSMNNAIADPSCRLIIVFTSIPVDARQYAIGNSGILFASYGQSSGDRPPNLLLIAPGRAESFREAGRRLGLIIAGLPEPEPAAVGILDVSPTSTAEAEIAAFREGVASASSGSTLLYRETRSVTDRTAALRALRELRADGARFYLLKTYALTGACLDELVNEGGQAVVEDCGEPGACGSAAVLSVETDWQATFGAVFAALGGDGASWRAIDVSEAGRVVEQPKLATATARQARSE